MYKHILVAVGPRFSEGALSVGAARARECNARLTVLHVIDTAPAWAGSNPDFLCGDALNIAEEVANVIRRRSEKLMESAGVNGAWQTRNLPVDGMSVGRVIANAANSLDADLVVLGARKHACFGIGAHRVRNAVCRNTQREVLVASQGMADQNFSSGLQNGSSKLNVSNWLHFYA